MEDTRSYDFIVNEMRGFFRGRGFVEVPAQSKLSILAACEDPRTISEFSFSGHSWPLPQTGQMWLEHELLTNPDCDGVYCITTSYRNEPKPIQGRHDKIFPMFEFEARGRVNDLMRIETELLAVLGFPGGTTRNYGELCEEYDVGELTAEHEERMWGDIGEIVFLTSFPQRTHPFWNMKGNGDGTFNKVDVILYGMETIGSAERSTDVDEMARNFETISDGEYARLLFDRFGEGRVMEELNRYLSLNMIERFGGGIGVTRMKRAMDLAGLLSGSSKRAAEATHTQSQ